MEIRSEPDLAQDPQEALRSKLRWSIGVLCASLSLIALLAAIAFKAIRIDQILLYSTAVYNELTKSAMDLKIHESNSYFDLSLLVVGALIGLILAKPEEARV